MKVILVVVAILVVAHLMLVGLALAEGLFLHWAIPSLDLSTAVLIALMATIATVYAAFQFLKIGFNPHLWVETEEDEDTEEDEEDEAPARRSSTTYAALPHTSRRRRRRNRR